MLGMLDFSLDWETEVIQRACTRYSFVRAHYGPDRYPFIGWDFLEQLELRDCASAHSLEHSFPTPVSVERTTFTIVDHPSHGT